MTRPLLYCVSQMLSLLRLQTRATPAVRAIAASRFPWSCVTHSSGIHSSPLRGFDLSITVGPNNIVRSPYPDVPVPNASLYSHVFRDFDKFGRKIALVNGETGREFSFSEIKEKTNRLSSALNRKGIGKGDVVALVAPNCPEYAIFFFGCLASEATVTTCNPAYTADELAYQFKNSDAKIVATVPECLDTVRKAAEMNGISDIIVIDESQQSEAGLISYQSLIEDSGSAFRTPQVDVNNDVAVLPYSSGTTGLAKGVMLTHKNIVTNICQLHHPQIFDFNDKTTLIGVIPFFHIYGMVVIMCSSLHHGCKAVTLPRFEPEMFLNALQSNKVTLAHLVPPLMVFLAKSPIVDNYDLTCIEEILSGAAPLGGDTITATQERIGCGLIRQGYGLSETSPVTHVKPLHFKMTKPDSIGTPVQNTEVKIADIETGESLPVGKEGEVCIRGGNVMKGYLNMPEATRSCLTDEGWFHTGDIGESHSACPHHLVCVYRYIHV